MPYIAALDQGTTSTRFIVFDHAGNIVASAQREHQQLYPQPGWVEHNPLEIVDNSKHVVADALIAHHLKVADIEAIGITNQRETTVVWNRHTGEPYYNAIVWQDTRTESLVQQMIHRYGKDGWRPKTGLPFATYFSGLKLKWLLDNIPGLQQAAENGDALFGTIDCWLIWQFTGNHRTDVTNASRTQLMNLHTLDWDNEILAALNIPKQMLPEITPSGFKMGAVAQGTFKGVPILGCLGDQQAALVGQTCFSSGEAKNTYGTGCFMLMNTGEHPIESKAGLLTTVAYQFTGQRPCYALEGSIAIAGALVQWLRDNMGIIAQSTDIEPLAASVADNGGLYMVPAFSGLYTPYWQSDARGIIAGMTAYATKAHLARAVLEATAYQTLDVLHAMEADGGIPLKALNVDGGMVVNQLLMQFQADMVRVPVQRPKVNETTALGAAYTAGLTAGFWSDFEDLRKNHQIAQTWLPQMQEENSLKLHTFWKKAVHKSMGWVA